MEALTHRLVRVLRAQDTAAEHIGPEQADEEREDGVAEEGDDVVREPQQLGEGAEGDQHQRHEDRQETHRQRRCAGVVVDQLGGLLLDHGLVDLLVPGRFPVAPAQQLPEYQRRHERGHGPKHEPVDQPGAERDLQQSRDGDRRESRNHENVAGENPGSKGPGHVRQAGAANEGRGGARHR